MNPVPFFLKVIFFIPHYRQKTPLEYPSWTIRLSDSLSSWWRIEWNSRSSSWLVWKDLPFSVHLNSFAQIVFGRQFIDQDLAGMLEVA